MIRVLAAFGLGAFCASVIWLIVLVLVLEGRNGKER